MQDIRSFFTQKNRGGNVKRKRTEEEDDDDDFQATKKKPTKKKSKKGGVIFDSDSDSDVEVVATPKAKSTSKSNGSVGKKTSPYMSKTPAKRKEVDALSFFGSSPVQRSDKKANKISSSRQKASRLDPPMLETEDHSDDDFQKTLEELDKKDVKSTKTSFASKLSEKMQTSKVLAPETPEVTKNRRSPRKRAQEAEASPLKTKNKARVSSPITKPQIKKEVIKQSPKKTTERTKTPEKPRRDSSTPKKSHHKLQVERHQKSPTKQSTTPKEASPPDTAEKKRGGGTAYRSYLQREGPRFLGSKELPKGEEGCLDGLSFVLTGVLEYFDKGELKTHIEGLGGAVRTNISKKTSYLVIGREPGESKTQKAQEMKVKMLDEDSLYELISSRPGKKVKPMEEAKKPTKKQPNRQEDVSPKTTKNIGLSKTQKEEFSWKPQFGNSQKSDSQGSELNSQESLGRQNPVDSKSTGQSQASIQMWVDKYKPVNSKQIIGQQGDKSNSKKLTRWLQRWHDNNFGANKDKARFNRDDGYSFKGALLSGPPGVGKTTTAQIVCKEVGYTYFELNASDARNKKTLQECVAEYLDNSVLGNFFGGKSKVKDQHKHCLIMDEVDGMSGNEDRGGIQELIQLIKGSRVPVICICNDRSHPKIRSLCNHCFDLRFQRPRLPQIKAAMLSVAFKEGVKIPSTIVDDMIMASNQDVRQILHNMSMWAAGERTDKSEGTTGVDGKGKAVKKDFKLGPWDVLRQVFSSSEENFKMTFNDKVGLFFHDYSIAPLFVQENYPSVIPRKAGGDIKKHLDLLSQTADSIAVGDLVDRRIRSAMKWNLLPLQAVFASVLPGEYMRGHLGGMINFPSWLGRNSTRGKFHRILQELQTHMRMSAATSLQSVNQEYLPHMRSHLTDPLLSQGADGVGEVVQLLNDYDLTREDFDNILELSQFPGFKEPMKAVPPKVKAAFTRTFNKSSHLNPFSIDIIGKAKGKKGGGFEDQSGLDGDTQEPEEEEEEDEKAILAKLKGKTTTKSNDASSKKGKGPAKGKGRAKGKK